MAFTIPNEADAFHADQAEPDAKDVEVIVAGFGLTGVLNGCAVTAQGSPDMTCAVAAGQVIVAGTVAAVSAGNVTITAADATNPRIDLVVVSNAGTKSVTAGTAAAAPVMPAIPANSVVLAAVYVPATDTTIATNQITDKRIVLASLPIGRGTAFPTSPATNDHFQRTDIFGGTIFFYDGTRWRSTTVFSVSFPPTERFSTFDATANIGRLPLPFSGTYAIYGLRFDVFWNTGGVAHNAGNFFTFLINGADIDDADTQYGSSMVTNPSTANKNYSRGAAIDAVIPTTVVELKLRATETGAATMTYCTGMIHYQIIAT